MAIKTYPLNDTDYQAEDAELFHCTRTSGVYASGHFPVSVTGTDNNITIGKGIGWLKNTEFSGKVFASKEEITLNAGVPDASLPRVDAVVVRFDANQNETYFTIKQGSVGSQPTPPEVERGEYIYELHLYHIRRRPGATAITPGDITDLRMDANYCGLMADSVTQVDMSAINAQIREFISDWENQIANVTDGKMIESPEYPGCYYRMNRGVKEWLNPPMMVDVEYATTKRQDGKRVYTKLLKARSQTGSASLPDIERIVSVFAVAERDWNGEKLMFQLPVDFLPEDSPTIQKMQIYYQGNTIVFQSAVTKGTYNLYITVSYTKPGDEVAYTDVTADGDTVNVETSGDVFTQGDNLNVEMFTAVSADGGAYIRRLTINGVAYDLAVGQAGSGVPGTAYPGVPGQFYTDLDSGEVYVCVGGSADAGVYIWRTIIPTNLPVTTLQINHKTGIGSATIVASQEAVMLDNNGRDAIVSGVANPVKANDVANKQYVDNLAFSNGSGTPGVSPTVTVSTITGGHRLTIVDVNGTKTVDVLDGVNGNDGRGIKSIARTSGNGEAGKVDTYTITYTDGTTSTYQVRNGANGTNGADGADGVGIARAEQITTSTADGGSNVFEITLSDGTSATFTVKNGSTGGKGDKGDKGDKGETGGQGPQGIQGPVGPQGPRGTDYVLTEEDKTEIAALVVEMLGGNPVWGYVEEATKSIILHAPEGDYTFYIELEDGSLVEIGKAVEDTNTYYSVTNALTNCVSSNSATQVVEGGSYEATITANSGYELESVTVTMGGVDISSTVVSGGKITIAAVSGGIVVTAVATQIQTSGYTNLADPTSADWQDGYRLSLSAGTTSAMDGHTTTNYIPANVGDVLRVKGLTIVGYYGGTTAQNAAKIGVYDSSKKNLGGAYGITGSTAECYGSKVTVAGDVSEYTLMLKNDGSQPSASVAYTRIDGFLMDGYTKDDVVITINEEITDGEVTPSYTNLFDPAGATLNAHLNSSAAVTTTDGYVLTNWMDVKSKTPFTADTKIYMKGVNISGDGSSRIFTYNTTGTAYANPNNIVNMNTVTVTNEGNGVISIAGLATAFASSVVRAVMCLKVSTSAITEDDIAGIVITIDEPIV